MLTKNFRSTIVLCMAMVPAVLFSCSEDADTPGTGSQTPQQPAPGIENPSSPAAPEWKEGYPEVVNGATTVDLRLAVKGPGKIYYAVYNTEPGFPSSEDVKSVALSKNDNNLVAGGELDVANARVDEQFDVVLENLPEGSTVYTYLVAEYADADTTIIQEVPEFRKNTLAKRQTENWFNSRVENRKAGYLAYLPEAHYLSSEPQPLLIFLGGNGETAQQGQFNLLRNHTLPLYIQQGSDYPFVVISPQHVQNNWNADFIDEVIELAKSKYNIDESRIYMTGISGGGFGTFNYAVKYADKLAAIVPIAGGGNTYKACELTGMAVWAFHGDKDNIVSHQKSVEMVKAINSCNPKPEVAARLTLYPGVYHNSWKMTYDGSAGHDIFTWLLQYSLGD